MRSKAEISLSPPIPSPQARHPPHTRPPNPRNTSQYQPRSSHRPRNRSNSTHTLLRHPPLHNSILGHPPRHLSPNPNTHLTPSLSTPHLIPRPDRTKAPIKTLIQEGDIIFISGSQGGYCLRKTDKTVVVVPESTAHPQPGVAAFGEGTGRNACATERRQRRERCRRGLSIVRCAASWCAPEEL